MNGDITLVWSVVSNFKPMKFWCMSSIANEQVVFVTDDKLWQFEQNSYISICVFFFFPRKNLFWRIDVIYVIFQSSYWWYQNDFITWSKFLCRSKSVAGTTLWPSNAIWGQMDKTNINLLISQNLTSNVTHSFAIKKYINQKEKNREGSHALKKYNRSQSWRLGP